MRRRRLLHALGVTGVAGVSGCLRLADAGGTTSATTASDVDATTTTATATATETETEVDEEPTTDADDRVSYPIGLDDEGVYAYLVDNHANTLSDTTFRMRWNAIDRTEGETMESMTSTVDDGRAIVERGVGVDLSVYYDADSGYWREDLGSRATYGEQRRGFDFQYVSKARDLRTVLLAGDWAPPTQADGGFEITASGVDEPTELKREFEAGELKTFEADGFVTPAGVLVELTAEFQYVDAEEERLREVRIRHRVDGIGEVAVSEPSWYGTATERAPDVTASLDDAREFLVFEHQGGNPVEPDTNVVVYGREGRGNWGYRDNQEPFEAGETVYLWMEDDRLRWNRGGRPSNANPQSLDRRLGFWMHRHGAEYFGNVELPT